MISQIAYSQIAGLPVVAHFGIATLLLLLFTAIVGFINFRGNARIPFKWHPRLAGVTIVAAIIHAIFALSIRLGF
jgi:hypothetical protein